MTIHTFVYRATQLRKPLEACLKHLREKSANLLSEINKDKQYLQDTGYDGPGLSIKNRILNHEQKVRSINSLIKKYEIFLYEVRMRGYFTKYTLDENDLHDLYQYRFTEG